MAYKGVAKAHIHRPTDTLCTALVEAIGAGEDERRASEEGERHDVDEGQVGREHRNDGLGNQDRDSAIESCGQPSTE